MIINIKFFFTVLFYALVQINAIGQTASQQPDSSQVFTVVEEMPEFQGGKDSLKTYIEKNIQYPAKAKAEGRQGVCYAQIIVEKDGSTSNIKLIRSIPNENDLNDEAIRVVGSLPKWKPGKQNGKFVRVAYIIPVRFKL